MPGLRHKLLSGTGYTLASVLVVQVISLLTSVIYARLLGSDNLGVLALLTQLSAAVVPLSSLGLGTAITKLIPEYRKKGPEELEGVVSTALLVVLGAGIVVSLAYFFSADYLAGLFGLSSLVPNAVLLIRISASLVVADALLTLATAIVQGFQRVKELAVIGLAARGAGVPVIFYFTLTWGLLGAIVAGIVGLALNLAIYFTTVRSILRGERVRFSRRRFDRRTATTILRIALPLFASFIVLRPALLFQQSYLALRLTFGDLGLYRIATSLYRIALILPTSLSVPLLPAISEMYAEGTRERTRGQLSSLLRITALLSLPLTLALALGSGPVISVLYGREYLEASTLVFVLSLAAFVDTIGLVVENTLLGTGRTLLVFALAGMQAIVISVASFAFISLFGLLGIGYAMLLNALLYAVVVSAYFLSKKEISFKGVRSSFGLAAVVFAIASGIVLVGGLNNLVVLVVFLGALLVVEFKLLSDRDRFVLKDALRGVFGGGS